MTVGFCARGWVRTRGTHEAKRRVDGRASGRPALVSMVKATDFRQGDHASFSGKLHASRRGSVFLERQMRTGPVIIGNVGTKDPAQMRAIDDDHMIQTLAANRAYNSLDESVLPRCSGAQTTSVIPIASTRLRKWSRTTRHGRAADSAEQCPTATLRLPGGRAKLRWDAR